MILPATRTKSGPNYQCRSDERVQNTRTMNNKKMLHLQLQSMITKVELKKASLATQVIIRLTIEAIC